MRLPVPPPRLLKRTTGFEPATPTLARWCSTTELRSHCFLYIKKCRLHDLNTRPSDYKSDALPTELWRIKLLSSKNSPYGIRTRVTAVKRRCLNPLTNGPSSEIFISLILLLLYQSIRFCLYFFSKKILNFAKFIRILR